MDDVTPQFIVDINHLDFSSKHFALAEKHLGEELDELTIILKSHLLVEELLRGFCEYSVAHPKYLREARLSFKQIFHLARSIYSLNVPRLEWTWGVVNSLNTMRNLMAHAIEPDEKKYGLARDVIIREVMSHTSHEVPTVPTFHGAVSYLYGVLGCQLQSDLILKAGGTAAQIPRPLDVAPQHSAEDYTADSRTD